MLIPTYMEYLGFYVSRKANVSMIMPKEVAKTVLVTDKEHFYHILPKRFGEYKVKDIV